MKLSNRQVEEMIEALIKKQCGESYERTRKTVYSMRPV